MTAEAPAKGLTDRDEQWRDEILASGGLCVPPDARLRPPELRADWPYSFDAPRQFDPAQLAPRKVYGLAEVAALTGRKRKKIRRWIAKGTIPAPSERLSTGPVWLAEDIEPWLRKYLTPGGPVRDSLQRFTVQRGAIQYPAPPSLRGDAP